MFQRVSNDVFHPTVHMVGRYREKQYQLAAQKHNETYLKYDYYQQIAKYFERECQIAKHYDSWNYKSLDPKGEIEKAKKAERLRARRNKLRILLKEEDETYRGELEERKRVKSRPEETSLERLREKLRERRVEQSLYLPRTCRRYQSYFVCPTQSNSSRWSTLKDTNLQYNHPCKESTNFVQQSQTNFRRKSYKMSDEGRQTPQRQDTADSQEDVSHHYASEGERPNSKYSARYARRSLENTNVRFEDGEYTLNRTPSRASLSYGHTSPNGDDPVLVDNKENNESRLLIDSEKDRVTTSRPFSSEEEFRLRDAHNDGLDQNSMDHLREDSDMYRVDSPVEHDMKEDQATTRNDTRQFEVEKSMPWLRMIPGDKNLSKPMFLYLTHKELKCKIEDLAKRETHACNKHCWDEALRLRDMRNKMELLREKKLYHMDTLDIDEDSRMLALVNIDKREAELTEREKVCMDSTMYNEDAKALWKKWVQEDEMFAIRDARLEREKLMNSLEKEWQNLAIRDKERISLSYQSVMNDSDLQEEHKLSAAINASRMKSSSGSLK